MRRSTFTVFSLGRLYRTLSTPPLSAVSLMVLSTSNSVGGEVHQPGVLPQVAQGHLELAGVQGVVPAEVPEFPLPRHPEGPAVHTLSPHPDALGGQARVAEHGHTVCAHPVIAPVVLLVLLLHPLPEHPLDLFLREAHILQRLNFVPVGVLG